MASAGAKPDPCSRSSFLTQVLGRNTLRSESKRASETSYLYVPSRPRPLLCCCSLSSNVLVHFLHICYAYAYTPGACLLHCEDIWVKTMIIIYFFIFCPVSSQVLTSQQNYNTHYRCDVCDKSCSQTIFVTDGAVSGNYMALTSLLEERRNQVGLCSPEQW